jgi:hypothetical protein
MRHRNPFTFSSRILFAALTLGSLPPLAHAQVFELGFGVSRACTGDVGRICGDDDGLMGAVYGGLWVSPRFQIAVRVAALPLEDFSYSTPRDDRFSLVDNPALRSLPRINITTRERRRVLSGAEALYHFGRSNGVGATVGVGLGTLSDRMVLSCEPSGCERILSAIGSPVGRTEGHVGNLTLIAGLSGRAWHHLQISGGVRLHNLVGGEGEGLSTMEAFTSVGVRLGAF